MAARRERERRRPPTEQRYRVEIDDGVEAVAEPVDTEQIDGTAVAAAAPASAAAKSPAPTSAAARGTSTGRAAPRHFSEYRAEYAYVGADLRRVALVIGSLLVLLIVLHFVIAR